MQTELREATANPTANQAADSPGPTPVIDFKQQINEVVANVPIEFTIGDKVLKLYSKSIARMVQIDKLILELQMVGNEDVSIDDDVPFEEAVKRVQENHERIIGRTVDILFNIINEDLDEPEHSKDWIMDTLDISEGGIGHQIMDAYNEKCNPSGFIKKILLSRKF